MQRKPNKRLLKAIYKIFMIEDYFESLIRRYEIVNADTKMTFHELKTSCFFFVRPLILQYTLFSFTTQPLRNVTLCKHAFKAFALVMNRSLGHYERVRIMRQL